MQHRISTDELGAEGHGMARAVSACVHCGFCLSACPTYPVFGEEMDSPRGRIMLMKQALEADLRDSDVRPYIDRCLGCLACETACPSGVQYRELVVPFRARLERSRPWHERAIRRVLLGALESPARFRAAFALGTVARRAAAILPAWRVTESLRRVLALLPPSLPPPDRLPAYTPARGQRRARVALLAGCVQQALRPGISAAALRVLSTHGVEVVVPPGQGCCGALALHAGLAGHGQRLARRTRDAFPSDVDAILTTAAGCGSAMKEQGYPARVQDVSEFLDGLGLATPATLPSPTTVAYHDACHLSHGQGVRSAPRRLLQQIGGLRLVEVAGAEICCGSAGLYNLEQPETAMILGRRKADAIRATGATLVATGNIGCITQLEAHLEVPIRHTFEILDSAYSGAGPARRD